MTRTSPKTKIVVICGPTGVGKTGFAVRLARRFHAEIVGADSMQIYRRMDIGTAKPTPGEQAAVQHHMVDIVDPDENFDAATYARRASTCIERLTARKIRTLVVGGTGLYIKALLHGLAPMLPSDPSIREQLQAAMAADGPAAMHARLAAVDPQAARRLHPNDRYRILRALEVQAVTGESIFTHHDAHGFGQSRYDTLKIGLTLPREELYNRIDGRVDLMLNQGLEEEVRGLLAQGYDPGLKSMQSLGYRHLSAVIREKLPLEEAVGILKRDHRRYAKRQMTWFRRDPQVQWLTPGQLDEADVMVEKHFGPLSES